MPQNAAATLHRGVIGLCAIRKGPLAPFAKNYKGVPPTIAPVDHQVAIVAPQQRLTLAHLLSLSDELANLVEFSDDTLKTELVADSSTVSRGPLRFLRNGPFQACPRQQHRAFNPPTVVWALVAYHCGTEDRLLGNRWLRAVTNTGGECHIHQTNGGHSIIIERTLPHNAALTTLMRA